MGAHGIGTAAQLLEHDQLSHAEAVVKHQSHTGRQLVLADDKILDTVQMLQLQIIGIEVVARLVATGKEGLTGILREDCPQLHIIAISQLVTAPMTVRIAQIAVLIALALIERQPDIAHQFMTAIAQDIVQTRE